MESHHQSWDELQTFSRPGQVEFHRHEGLIYCEVNNQQCRGRFYLLGAHVTDFHPRHTRQPLLFMSEAANFREGSPIRGGIPICFPWFGPHDVDENAPAHGLVRQKMWALKEVKSTDEQTQVLLVNDTEHFHVAYRVTFAETLETDLMVHNTTDSTQRFEVALHTYFRLSDVNHVTVRGLEYVAYLDQLTGETVPESGEPIRFTRETDRVYLQTEDPIEIQDPGFHRRIRIEKKGSESTVVWNPWTTKAQRMADFGDYEWPSMCCIETANVGNQAISLEPDERHHTVAIHSVSS